MPEQTSHARPRIAALILAAGRSTRMGTQNKLLVEVDGKPVLARVVDAVVSSRAKPVIVVTGHQSEQIKRVLARYDVKFVHNPRYANGISTSLRRGIATLPPEIDGAFVCLGDMPWVNAAHLERLIGRFDPAKGCAICVPTFDGKTGNPVLWSKHFFPEMRRITGDIGARQLIVKHTTSVCHVEMSDAAVLLDVDGIEDLTVSRRALT